MSLIDDLSKLNLNDPSEGIVEKDLTKEEELGLSEMFQSSSWSVFTTKVLPKILKVIALRALVTQTDHRFHQGMFFGFKQFVDGANDYKNVGFDKKVAEQMQENFEDATGYERMVM